MNANVDDHGDIGMIEKLSTVSVGRNTKMKKITELDCEGESSKVFEFEDDINFVDAKIVNAHPDGTIITIRTKGNAIFGNLTKWERFKIAIQKPLRVLGIKKTTNLFRKHL